MKSWMQKKMMVIAMLVLICCAAIGITSVGCTEVYADVTQKTESVQESTKGTDNKAQSDKKMQTSKKEAAASSEPADEEEEGGFLNYRNADGKDSLLCILICACAGLGILTVVLMSLESRKKTAAKQQAIFEEYDQLYDKYRNYYACSAEQILRAEKYNRPLHRRKVENMKETVLEIYDKMEDEKQLFDGIRGTQTAAAAKRREDLYNKSRHNIAKLEHCLVVLKDVNKTCVL